MGKRLQLLSSHDALLLLRHSLSIPKVLYILHTTPCFLTDLFSTFDDHLRTLLSEILNVNLANESAWTQASLPVKAGGLGISKATQLAPSAYLASAAGCSELIQLILPSKLRGLTDPYLATGVEVWRQGSSADRPYPSQLTQQHAWDSVLVETDYESLLENAATSLEKARLLAVAHHDSGAWLNAFPISALGLRLDDSEVQIAISLRLGLPVCSAHMCAGCGAAVDERGLHGLSCRFSKGRFSRHSALNDLVKRSLDSAKIPSHLEPTGLYRTDGKRPDGATLVPWKGGRVLVWDVTCADTLAPSHRQLASREAGAVAASAEQRKKNKYAHLEATHHFVPIAIETLGVVGEEGSVFFKDLGRRISIVTQEKSSHQFLLQRVSMAIQRGNAASVMGTLDWTQIDQEFTEQQREKLAAEEEVGQQQKKQQHKQGSAELTLTDEKLTNIHPLLSEEMEHSSQTQQTQSGSELFSCIDTNKLHGTLETAVALSTVEQGVTASMLPVQVVANKKQEPAEKELPSPTGKKGCALFDFEGQKEADLSFNKGACHH